MISRDSSLDEIKDLIKNCLSEVYVADASLFERNRRNGVGERCLVFRFAHYLQNKLNEFSVDCDFNSSFEGYVNLQGRFVAQERQGKPIRNVDGSTTNRFVDIIVHKRNFTTPSNDFICFELKKWNNPPKEKDINNLCRLTSDYGYKYGFLIRVGKSHIDLIDPLVILAARRIRFPEKLGFILGNNAVRRNFYHLC